MGTSDNAKEYNWTTAGTGTRIKTRKIMTESLQCGQLAKTGPTSFDRTLLAMSQCAEWDLNKTSNTFTGTLTGLFLMTYRLKIEIV